MQVVDPVPCAVKKALADVGVKETRENGGPQVDVYLASVKLGTGHYWCGAFVHHKFRQCGIVLEPAREYAMALRYAKDSVVYRKGDDEAEAEPGDVFSMNYGKGKGHCGIVVEDIGEEVVTVEGNTSDGGSRNGNGVYKRIRDERTLWTISRY